MQSTATLPLPGLSEQFQELLQHPDFLYDVETEKHGQTKIFTFDTDTSNFDLILEPQSFMLFQYDFVPSPDGKIDDYDVNFVEAHQIESVQQFLDLVK